jgi:hypothetical protein
MTTNSEIDIEAELANGLASEEEEEEEEEEKSAKTALASPNPAKTKKARAGTPGQPAVQRFGGTGTDCDSSNDEGEGGGGGSATTVGKACTRKGTPYKVRFKNCSQDEVDTAALREWEETKPKAPLQSCLKQGTGSSSSGSSSGTVVSTGEGGRQTTVHLHFN